MALITEIIPQQGFEIVRDRLGAILFTEISNQITLQSLDDTFECYIDRSTAYDKSEDVMINVYANSAAYSGQNQVGSQEDITCFVDIFAGAKQTLITTGDTKSLSVLDKYLGMCRYILASTKYKTLDFPYGFVTRVYVENWQKDDNYGREQADFIRMARLTVSVVCAESQGMWEGVPLSGIDTTIKLGQTELGYRLEFNN